MTRPDAESPFGIHNPGSLDNVIIVHERLANTHKDNVGNAFFPGKMIFHMECLFNDLTGGKVPFKTRETAGTELARHGASYLG
jgi:hypothetical protein